jgi:hypothetical protein
MQLASQAKDAALQGLAAYEFGPGYAHGLREYCRKRHEKRHEQVSAAHRLRICRNGCDSRLRNYVP